MTCAQRTSTSVVTGSLRPRRRSTDGPRLLRVDLQRPGRMARLPAPRARRAATPQGHRARGRLPVLRLRPQPLQVLREKAQMNTVTMKRDEFGCYRAEIA